MQVYSKHLVLSVFLVCQLDVEMGPPCQLCLDLTWACLKSLSCAAHLNSRIRASQCLLFIGCGEDIYTLESGCLSSCPVESSCEALWHILPPTALLRSPLLLTHFTLFVTHSLKIQVVVAAIGDIVFDGVFATWLFYTEGGTWSDAPGKQSSKNKNKTSKSSRKTSRDFILKG